MITAADAILKFKEIVSSKQEWLLLMQSQFLRFSAIFQSWAVRDALFKVERAEQEYFISTCINRASVLAHMEDRGYIPRKPQPSYGTFKVENSGSNSVLISAGTMLYSASGRNYRVETDRTIAAGATETGIAIKQIAYSEYAHTVTAEKPFYEILIPLDLMPYIHAFTVNVYNSDTEEYEAWEYSRRFKTVTGEKIFDEFYSHTDQIGIRFGNSTFGSILPVGTGVRLDLTLTDGDTSLLAGQRLYPSVTLLDTLNLPANVRITVDTAIAGGAGQEDIEESRRNLMYWFHSDDLVWAEDYISYVKTGVGGITWMNVWGEQEQEAVTGPDFANVNKIFLSAYRPLMADGTLSAAVLARLTGINPLGRAFQWVTPEFVSFTVEIKAYMPRSTKNLTEVEQSLRNLFESAYSLDSPLRKNTVVLKDFYDVAASSGYFGKSEAYFTVEYNGITAEIKPNEILNIDLAGSVFTAEYVQ